MEGVLPKSELVVARFSLHLPAGTSDTGRSGRQATSPPARLAGRSGFRYGRGRPERLSEAPYLLPADEVKAGEKKQVAHAKASVKEEVDDR